MILANSNSFLVEGGTIATAEKGHFAESTRGNSDSFTVFSCGYRKFMVHCGLLTGPRWA
jgi:hypothetical protein